LFFYDAILPPRRVMATADDRGGMSGLKSANAPPDLQR